MCFGEAEPDAFTKGLRSAQGDPGILDVPGMTHPSRAYSNAALAKDTSSECSARRVPANRLIDE